MLAWAEGSLGTEAGGLVTSKPVHCGVCGHEGSVASHRRGGCGRCGTHANCRSELYRHILTERFASFDKDLLIKWCFIFSKIIFDTKTISSGNSKVFGMPKEC